ncbi:MAG: SDR family NAD(P)-dependent oxidoreductase [Oscillospiraceae bacterium]
MTAAVITGASAGLGAEFTRQLVREFPDIEEFWLIARRVGKLEELAQQFPEKKFVCIGLNLLDPKSFRYLGEKLAEQKVDVRLLVNNAGCGTTGNIGASASSADVMRVVDLNVRALTMVTQTVVPFMTRGAKIINVSSIAAFCPTPRMTVYSASKAYVSAFTGGLADELRPKGITVTAVCPGPMKTEFFDAAGDHDLFGNILVRPSQGRRRDDPGSKKGPDVLHAHGLQQVLSLRGQDPAHEVDDKSNKSLIDFSSDPQRVFAAIRGCTGFDGGSEAG